MAFTKIKNEDVVQITLPSALGSVVIPAGTSAVVAFDAQTVAAAMATAGIIAYGMESVANINTVDSVVYDDLSFYADVAIGNDANPGTQALPVKTVEALLALVPVGGHQKSCNLFLAAGTYPWNALSAWSNPFSGSGVKAAPPVLIGAYTTIFGPVAVTNVNSDGSVTLGTPISALTSGTGTGSDAFTFSSPSVTLTVAAGGFVVAGVKAGMSVTIAGSTTPANNGTFLITAVTATTLVFTNTAGFAEVYTGTYNVTTDRYFGTPRFTVVSGPGAGSTRICAGNTSTTLLPNTPFTGIASGSVVQLEVPSVTITLNQTWIQALGEAGYKGLTFKWAAGTGFVLTEGSIGYFEGCIMDFTAGGGITLGRVGCRLNGPTVGPWTAQGTSSPFSSLRNNGVFIDGLQATATGLNIFNGGNVLGNHVLRNVDVGCNTNSFISAVLHGRNSSITCADASTLSLSGTSAASRLKFSGNRAGTPWVIGVFDNSALIRANAIDITNCIGNPLQIGADTTAPSGTFYGRGGAVANIGDVAGSVGNTGIGIKYTKGSYVIIDAIAGATATSVTGVLGDTEGRRPTTDTNTYTTVRSADGYGVKGYQDPYRNRIEPAV